MKKILLMLLSVVLLASCEDVIEIDLDEGTPQLTVDAWVTNTSDIQVIKLKSTAPYFANEPTPAVLDAEVTITDNEGNSYTFTDINRNGNYTYMPVGDEFNKIGTEYTLNVKTSQFGEYQSKSKLNRVPAIDSLTFRKQEVEFGRDTAGYLGEMWARDLVGAGDCYWIRGYKNGKLNSKPENIILAYDGSTGRGAATDGILFILPIRLGINTGVFQGEVNQPGDSITAEIYSISEDAFQFLAEVQTQIQNGGLFAEPPANVRTNVKNVDPKGLKPVGYFSMSAVSRVTEVVKEIE